MTAPAADSSHNVAIRSMHNRLRNTIPHSIMSLPTRLNGQNHPGCSVCTCTPSPVECNPCAPGALAGQEFRIPPQRLTQIPARTRARDTRATDSVFGSCMILRNSAVAGNRPESPAGIYINPGGLEGSGFGSLRYVVPAISTCPRSRTQHMYLRYWYQYLSTWYYCSTMNS